jgi:hypothetical protein
MRLAKWCLGIGLGLIVAAGIGAAYQWLSERRDLAATSPLEN